MVAWPGGKPCRIALADGKVKYAGEDRENGSRWITTIPRPKASIFGGIHVCRWVAEKNLVGKTDGWGGPVALARSRPALARSGGRHRQSTGRRVARPPAPCVPDAAEQRGARPKSRERLTVRGRGPACRRSGVPQRTADQKPDPASPDPITDDLAVAFLRRASDPGNGTRFSRDPLNRDGPETMPNPVPFSPRRWPQGGALLRLSISRSTRRR